MTRHTAGLTSAILLAGLALGVPPAAAQVPALSAAQVAERVMEALGGEQAWNDTRFLRFTFAGRRTHWWDKQTGRHRLEGKTQEGEPFVVLHHLDTREGEVWVGGEKAEGEKAAELLERAYAAWINDTYWLLMPYKLQDPGVNLAYEGRKTLDGTDYHVLHLSFGEVGLTPGDQYWAYVHPGTWRMDRWAYLLESMERDAEPVAWRWEGWQRHGDVWLAPKRVQVGGDRVLELSDVAVEESMPDAVFTSPEPVGP
jgi:hypothetical protein